MSVLTLHYMVGFRRPREREEERLQDARQGWLCGLQHLGGLHGEGVCGVWMRVSSVRGGVRSGRGVTWGWVLEQGGGRQNKYSVRGRQKTLSLVPHLSPFAH